jgi:hypothetical protein
MSDDLPLPQLANDFDRLLEHLESLAGGWPALTENVLVEVFPGAEPEHEAAGHHVRDGRRGLGNVPRVEAQDGTCHACAYGDSLRLARDRAEHGPDERAVSLPVDPGVKVVGDESELEPSLLGKPSLSDEFARRELLARERVAEVDGHRASSRSK